MATYTLGLYSNSTFVSQFDGSPYTGGLGGGKRIEYDNAHIQNITITDTQTGTSSAFNYTNTNTSGSESTPTGTISNDAILNSGAYSGGQTVDTFVAADGTVYNDVPIVATESYRVALYDSSSGSNLVDMFWVTSVYLDLDGDGVKDANENDFFVSSRDLSQIPETYRVDFQTYNTSYDNGFAAGYVTAAATSTPGPVDGTDGADNMQIGYTDAGGDIIDGADGVNDTIFGYGGNDTIVAGAGRDSVLGGTGDDFIQGGGERDTILGEGGNDTIWGGANDSDWLFGGAGDDRIVGGTGDNVADHIWGGTGNDDIEGGGGDDVLLGEDGNDTIDGGSGSDTIEGGIGDDRIVGGTGNDTVDAGDGNDFIDAGQTSNAGEVEEIYGGAGNDTVLAGWGADTVDGGDGIDTYSQTSRGSAVNIDLNAGTTTFAANSDVQTVTNFENATGGWGDDTITGSSADNILIGDGAATAAGDDTISGLGGDDTIDGGAGTDSISGDSGNDTIDAGADADTVMGGIGDDSVVGGDGNDLIYGDYQGTPVTDDFSVDANGWKVTQGLGGAETTPTHNADGSVSFTDTIGGAGYFVAPASYTSSLGAMVGGSLVLT